MSEMLNKHKQQHNKRYYTSMITFCQIGYVFSLVCFVSISAGLQKNPKCHETWRKCKALAKDSTISIWSGSKSQGVYTHYFSLIKQARRRSTLSHCPSSYHYYHISFTVFSHSFCIFRNTFSSEFAYFLFVWIKKNKGFAFTL